MIFKSLHAHYPFEVPEGGCEVGTPYGDIIQVSARPQKKPYQASSSVSPKLFTELIRLEFMQLRTNSPIEVLRR